MLVTAAPYPPAPASFYQRMLPNGTLISQTGSRQFVVNGVLVQES